MIPVDSVIQARSFTIIVSAEANVVSICRSQRFSNWLPLLQEPQCHRRRRANSRSPVSATFRSRSPACG